LKRLLKRLLIPMCLALVITSCKDWRKPFEPKTKDYQKLAAARTPLPDGAYQVRWDGHNVPPEMQAGAPAVVRVTFTNTGAEVWPDPLSGDPEKHDGGYAVRLGQQWIDASTDPAQKPTSRTDLPRPVRPGETITLLINVTAPAQPGDYMLSFELVQELVAWFTTKGGAKLDVPVKVRAS